MEIITKIAGNVDNINDIEQYHVETIFIENDALNKPIQRLKSDHGNEYGLKIDRGDLPLHDGDIVKNDGHNIVMLHTRSKEMIVISPKNIDEMGQIAHLLGNTHKPVKVENGKIILDRDPVVEKILNHNDIKYELKEMVLTEPLKFADLSYD